MTIQLNTDNNLNISATFSRKLNNLFKDELGRFGDYITRLEVHLSDENGNKKGQKDKKCLLEARLAGKPPIAVTDFGDSMEQAVNGAVNKLKTSLDTIIGRMKSHSNQ
jgi:ribosome-associated translation inhibitor RaiA